MVTVVGSIAWLNVAVTAVDGGMLMDPAAGVRPVTAGGGAAVVNDHTTLEASARRHQRHGRRCRVHLSDGRIHVGLNLGNAQGPAVHTHFVDQPAEVLPPGLPPIRSGLALVATAPVAARLAT